MKPLQSLCGTFTEPLWIFLEPLFNLYGTFTEPF